MRKKLLDFQREVKAITKDATNPFFKSKYFDINGLIGEIKPILNKVGLVIVQPIIVRVCSNSSGNSKQTLNNTRSTTYEERF